MGVDAVTAFESLTVKALEEETTDGFIDLLRQRSSSLTGIIGDEIRLDGGMARDWLDREEKILQKLNEERRKVLQRMEELSKTVKMVKSYSPIYPLPMNPVFFDKIS